MWDYLAGEVEYDEMRYRGIVATRQLAKRQMTWLRGWPDVTWLESGESGNLARVVARWSGLTLLYNQVVILNIRCLKTTNYKEKKDG